MALIKCNGCGHMISDKAVACPKCGTPIVRPVEREEEKVEFESVVEKAKSGKEKTWIVTLLSVLLLVVVGYLIYDKVIVSKDTSQSVIKQFTPVILKGTVGKDIGNVLRLTFLGGEVEGTEHYDSQPPGTIINLMGTIDVNGHMLLHEYDKGKECGRLEGTYDESTFKGSFYASNGKIMTYSAEVVTEQQLEKLVKTSVLRLTAKAYGKKLDALVQKSPDCEYFLFDITGDGNPELWVKQGSCEADYKIIVFTYENGAKQIYEGGAGHSEFYQGTDYVIQLSAHMGYSLWMKLTYSGKMRNETIFEEDISGTDRDYREPSERYINLIPAKNRQAIDAMI